MLWTFEISYIIIIRAVMSSYGCENEEIRSTQRSALTEAFCVSTSMLSNKNYFLFSFRFFLLVSEFSWSYSNNSNIPPKKINENLIFTFLRIWPNSAVAHILTENIHKTQSSKCYIYLHHWGGWCETGWCFLKHNRQSKDEMRKSVQKVWASNWNKCARNDKSPHWCTFYM